MAIVPNLLGWNLDQSSPQFLAFVVLTHLDRTGQRANRRLRWWADEAARVQPLRF